MKLNLYDKFWEHFPKLDKKVQKDVVNFQRKFRENSKSAAIHLEPISTFKDSSLRTARINLKYRAIIKVPDKGSDIYSLLWVDNHDEAMDWARNKIIQWNENTQTLQVFSAPDAGEQIAAPTEKPTEKTGMAKYKDKELLQIGVPEILLPSVRQIGNMDDLDAIENYLPREVFEHIFYLLDGVELSTVLREIEDGKSKSSELEAQQNSLNNQRSFIQLTDDMNFEALVNGTLDKWLYYLHPSQRILVEKNNNGPVKVSGGAGTGKTVVALHRLKHLTSSFKLDRPVLFTTYTKALTQNLEELINNLEIDSNKVVVKNINLLVSDLAKEHGVINDYHKIIGLSAVTKNADIWRKVLESNLVSYDESFIIQEYRDIILNHDIKDLQSYFRTSRTGRGKAISRKQRAELWQIFEAYNAYKKANKLIDVEELYNMMTTYLREKKLYLYSHCIVDELQDLSNPELRFIRALTEEKSNDLFLVGDPMQKIYNKRINFSSVGINVRGRSKRLKINYRTTEEIKKKAVHIIKNLSFDDFDGEEEKKNGYISLLRGMDPTYTVFDSKQEEYDFILAKIRDLVKEGSRYSEIAIGVRTKNALKDYTSQLHNNKIDYQQIHGKERLGKSTGVKLATFHSMKGLEFKHVIMADVHKSSVPKLPMVFESWDDNRKSAYKKGERSLLYVAITRAIQSVTITGAGQRSDFFNQ